MDVYVARQPIFDREMKLRGYELLYRQGRHNYYEGTDDQKATATVLSNSVLVAHFSELVDGKRGFINFPGEFLTAGLPRLLPRKKIVVEILERVQATDAVIAACRRLKRDGYTIALDDFSLSNSREYRALIELADIIKIEFPKVRIPDQLKLIRALRDKTIFLAEKVETVQQYQLAMRMGYQLFQGYFFSKPAMINKKDIGMLSVSLVTIIKELERKEPDVQKMAGLIEKDLGLSYKVLRLANTVNFGSRYPVRSMQQALVRIGSDQLLQWMHLFLLNSVRNTENNELIKASMIRGKIMALLSNEIGSGDQESDYFIAGIFSSIDSILNDSMDHIIDGLPLDLNVREALLGRENAIRRALDSVIACEQANWEALKKDTDENSILSEKYMTFYLRALKWRKSIPKDPV
ncbi:EAL and HDOD domain-containing protein [Sporolactobacillus vineae]|uniref:EAL and HDOD domain-containing protein n=1 Tax=Sporolactobacillus vineae TaxID=444463 RepID=UPI000289C091|nr:HDOD domain-containing protein [Sporolactobacillus vineae]